jgi:gliding motility-associated-like protein
MTKKLFYALALTLAATAAFSQTADQTVGCTPLVVMFSPPAGANSYYWEFGVGAASSTEANPAYPYINPGTYTASFRETPGGPVLGTITITAYPKPDLDIAADPDAGCRPLAVDFTNNSAVNANIPVTGWEWVFGDGTSSTLEDPSHTYTNQGNFTVSLELTTAYESCNKTEIFPDFIEVSNPPNVNFTTTPSPPSSCTAPLTVTFNNTSAAGLTYTWDFGNGTTSTEEDPPAVTYDAVGVYAVTLTGTNALGCSATRTVQVTVGPPLSQFELPDTICIGDTVMLDNTSSAGVYQWNFGAGATPMTSSQFEPTVIFNQGGTFTVSLRVLFGACEATTTTNIYVEQLDPGFSFDPAFSCQYNFDVQFTPNQLTGVAQYKWVFEDDSTFVQSPVHTIRPFSNNPYFIEKDTNFNQVILQLTSLNGCVFTDTNFIQSYAPTAKFEVDVVDGCAPLTVEFKDSSIVQTEIVDFEWHFGDGMVTNTASPTPFTHVYQTPGEYNAFLIVTNQYGCMDTSYLLPIHVGELLNIDFIADQTEVCPGDTVRFTSLNNDPRIDAWHFQTDGGRSWHCFQENALDWSFVTEAGEPMDASLTVEYNGCFTTVEKPDYINVKGPIARLDYSMDCASPYDYVFADSSYDATNVTWYFGDSTQSNQPFVTHTYATRDSFLVILEAENTASGCPISRDSALIFVREIKAAFELDTILCTTQEYVLDGSPSQDVDARCYRGYTWLFSNDRPLTTAESGTPYYFGGPEEDQWLALEVTDINGCRDTVRLDVKVFELTADFELDKQRICFPSEVSFTDQSSGDLPIVEWEWEFGDGNTSTDQNPMHTFLNPPTGGGDLTVQLTVIDSVGCKALTDVDLSYYFLESDIGTVPIPNICVGQEVDFTATDFTQEGSNLTWEWDLGNGQTATGQTASGTYTQDGSFVVKVVFEEAATQCRDSSFTTVNVQDFPTAAFTSSFDNIPPPICYPQNGMFQNTSQSAYPITLQQWNFGNGQTASGNSPSASFGKGTFDVRLIVATSFGCRDTFTNSYTLVGPEGDFDISANDICVGGEITVTLRDTLDLSSFEWNFGDGVSVPDQNPVTHEYADNVSGQVTVFLILRGENDACTLEPVPFEIVNIIDPVASFSVSDPDNAVCLGEAFAFQNSSLLTNAFDWDFGDGTSTSANSPEHTYDSPGTYTVELVATNTTVGCTDSTTLELAVYQVPQPTVDGTELCSGDSTTLTIVGSEGSSFVWSPATQLSGGVNTGSEVTTLPLTQPTTFTVNETTVDGCQGTAQVEVQIVPILEPITKDTLATCIDAPVTLTVPTSEFYTYSWLPVEGLSCTDCTEAIFTTPTTMTVYAFPEDIYGLGCVSDTFVFHVVVPEGMIEMPNAFSPNGDQINDHFNFVTDGSAINDEITVRTFRVFNRFGQKVYDNQDPLNGWNGEQNNKPAASDVYIYQVELYLDDCFLGMFEGDVTLLR